MQSTQIKNKGKPEMSIKLKYEMKSALYANQFILNQAADELFVDFSSGAIPDPETGHTMIPIHTRMAFSFAAAERLANLLMKAVDSHKKNHKNHL